MNYILNFGHPLSNLQKDDLTERLGEFIALQVPSQYDLNDPAGLRYQVYEQVSGALAVVGPLNKVIAVIPPSMADPAYWLGLILKDRGYHNIPAIWFKRDRPSDSLSPILVGGVE